jgi:hypothetical protein
VSGLRVLFEEILVQHLQHGTLIVVSLSDMYAHQMEILQG